MSKRLCYSICLHANLLYLALFLPSTDWTRVDEAMQVVARVALVWLMMFLLRSEKQTASKEDSSA